MIKFLMTLFSLLITSNAHASNASGGGPVFLDKMSLIQESILNPNTITPNTVDIITDDYIGEMALGITDFDTVKASAIFDAYNTDITEKVQAYYQAKFGEKVIAPSDVAFKSIEASVLSEYGGFSQQDALDAVMFEPEFANSAFKELIDFNM